MLSSYYVFQEFLIPLGQIIYENLEIQYIWMSIVDVSLYLMDSLIV